MTKQQARAARHVKASPPTWRRPIVEAFVFLFWNDRGFDVSRFLAACGVPDGFTAARAHRHRVDLAVKKAEGR